MSSERTTTSIVNEDIPAVGGDPKLQLRVNKRLWQGQLTVYWAIGSLFCVWFLFIEGMYRLIYMTKYIQPVGPFFAFHLIGSYIIVLACIWNMFHTPASGPLFKKAHLIIGKIAVPSSVIGAFAGMIAAWWERKLAFANSVGLTCAGIVQIVTTVLGFYAIYKARRVSGEAERSKWINTHQNCMNVLFFIGCMTPALVRLMFYIVNANAFGGSGVLIGMLVGIALLSGFTVRAIRAAKSDKKL
eukprot:TRINITY_DN8164_c0_g1_i1.p1 TRINITY_DN8164_c0_g1~~TRINITY_DN8164_c0_g1_i1.p1  ORF type:complete len:243 (-),score=60.22 TRINITY_DN8164_c0_g1_i1:74-802(-)